MYKYSSLPTPIPTPMGSVSKHSGLDEVYNTIVLVVAISSDSDEDSETSDTLHVSVLDLSTR